MDNQLILKQYICPMHLESVSEKPGRCPKCGMDLVVKESKPVVIKHKRSIKDFLPIIIIFASIFIFTTIAILARGSWSAVFTMRMMMGSFFLVFGSFKIFNLKAFVEAYSIYDIVAKRSRMYAFAYPFLELTIAGLYLVNLGGVYRDIFTFVLMLISTVGVIQKIRQKETIPCACLGMVFKVPMTWVTLIEDVVMALEAFFMAIMAVSLPLAYSDTTSILVYALRTHTSAELAYFSDLGHWIIAGFIVIVLLGSIFDRFKVNRTTIFCKYVAPIAFILPGLGLSVVDVIFHSIQDPTAVRYLLTHISQLQQHFFIGTLFIIAGIAEWVRTRGGKQWLSFVVPTVMFLIGAIFFFHQQLGAATSVIDSMNWHMFLGAMLILGAVFRGLDILFFEEQKWFFVIWVTAILIAIGMMVVYEEPEGAYLFPKNIIQTN